MGAYRGVCNFLKIPITTAAQRLYGDRNDILYVLNSEEEKLKIEYPIEYKNICSYDHKKDNRTSMEFAKDMVASWIFEDIFRIYFSSDGCKFNLNGSDNKRIFIPDDKITNNSDFKVYVGNKMYKVELMTDYTNYIKTHGVLHLRDKKYKRLKREQSLLLVISTTDKTFLLIDVLQPLNGKWVESHDEYGNKESFEVEVDIDKFLPLDKDVIRDTLIKTVNLR